MQNNQLTNKEALTVLCYVVKHLCTYQWFVPGWGGGGGGGGGVNPVKFKI